MEAVKETKFCTKVA